MLRAATCKAVPFTLLKPAGWRYRYLIILSKPKRRPQLPHELDSSPMYNATVRKRNSFRGHKVLPKYPAKASVSLWIRGGQRCEAHQRFYSRDSYTSSATMPSEFQVHVHEAESDCFLAQIPPVSRRRKSLGRNCRYKRDRCHARSRDKNKFCTIQTSIQREKGSISLRALGITQAPYRPRIWYKRVVYYRLTPSSPIHEHPKTRPHMICALSPIIFEVLYPKWNILCRTCIDPLLNPGVKALRDCEENVEN